MVRAKDLEKDTLYPLGSLSYIPQSLVRVFCCCCCSCFFLFLAAGIAFLIFFFLLLVHCCYIKMLLPLYIDSCILKLTEFTYQFYQSDRLYIENHVACKQNMLASSPVWLSFSSFSCHVALDKTSHSG